VKSICRALLETWTELELGPAPRSLECLLRTPRFKASSHVLFFVFADGDPEPVLIAKTPRLPGDHGALEREVTNLQILAAIRPTSLGSVPRVVAYRDWQSSKLLVETVVPGRPMAPAVVRRDPRRCLEGGMQWVTELHFATRAFVTGASGSMRKQLESLMQRLEAAFPHSTEVARMVTRTRELAEPLTMQILPRVFEHGDLSSPNVLIDEGRVGVVDWELANQTGWPAVDAYFFLTYVAFARADAGRTGKHVDAFADAFFGSPAWARPYVMDYAKALGLSSRSLRPLFLLTWVRYVASLVTRLQDDGARQDASALLEWLSGNRYFSLWRFTLEHWKELDL
jgi:aminoglycoside phosphotransferase (APT) family kinase protein